MMNNYVDYQGFYHDSPVNEHKQSSSNNGWIYSAYAFKLGLPVDLKSYEKEYNDSVIREKGVTHILRRSFLKDKPNSRDEYLGMSFLGVLKKEHLVDWNFSPYPVPKFNLIKLIKQLYELSPNVFLISKPTKKYEKDYIKTFLGIKVVFRHRNHFWENNLDQLYRFAFSIPIQDRDFILNGFGKYNLFYDIVSRVNKLLTYDKNGIYWLKYGGDIKNMQKEFPEDHPFRRFE